MSMDEVERTMICFTEQLNKFNEILLQSISDLRDHHDAVSPLWQDEMRRKYDDKWLPLEESMDQYIDTVGPHYVEVLITKIQYLREYLHGSY